MGLRGGRVGLFVCIPMYVLYYAKTIKKTLIKKKENILVLDPTRAPKYAAY